MAEDNKIPGAAGRPFLGMRVVGFEAYGGCLEELVRSFCAFHMARRSGTALVAVRLRSSEPESQLEGLPPPETHLRVYQLTEEQLAAQEKFDYSLSPVLVELIGDVLTINERHPDPEAALTVDLFCEWLPTKMGQEADPPSLSQAPGNTSPETDPLLGYRVLVADDRPDVARIVSFYLEDAGADVKTVANGALAVDALFSAKATFDVIILDMQMPVLDGFGAAREMRRRGYAGPLIALTAGVMRENMKLCLDAGCTSFLNKPAEEIDLIQLVRSEADRYPVA